MSGRPKGLKLKWAPLKSRVNVEGVLSVEDFVPDSVGLTLCLNAPHATHLLPSRNAPIVCLQCMPQSFSRSAPSWQNECRTKSQRTKSQPDKITANFRWTVGLDFMHACMHALLSKNESS